MNWNKYNIDELTDALYERYLGMMSPERRERVARKAIREDRLRSVAGELLVRRAVSEALGICEEAVPLCSDGRGAPTLDGTGLFVSIAHSGNYAVCALSDTPVGIDIEEVRPMCGRVATGTFSVRENEYLGADGYELSGETLVRFFEIWTAKEAYGKMKGEGVTLSDTVDTTTIPVKRKYFDGYVVSIVCEEES